MLFKPNVIKTTMHFVKLCAFFESLCVIAKPLMDLKARKKKAPAFLLRLQGF
jgi:hypothetical protein